MSKTTDQVTRIQRAPGAPAYEPIQTYFAGVHFRSRIEARHAVLLSALKVPWHYEAEGFHLGPGVMYLPDFWLPAQDCWLEIKGAPPTEEEQRKAALLAEATGKRVVLFHGAIPHEVGEAGPPEDEAGYLFAPGACTDHGYAWCECPRCGLLGIEFQARTDRLPCKRCGCERSRPGGDRGHNGNSWRLRHSYQAARHCRFDRSDRPFAGLH